MFKDKDNQKKSLDNIITEYDLDLEREKKEIWNSLYHKKHKHDRKGYFYDFEQNVIEIVMKGMWE